MGLLKSAGTYACSALAFAALGCQAPNIADVTFELSASEPLRVNTQLEHYRTKRSRAKGEQELIALAKYSQLEEAWLSDGDDWVEIGFDEQTNHAYADVREPFLSLGAKDSAVFYHIHPKETVRDMWKKCNASLEDGLKSAVSDEERDDLQNLIRDVDAKRNYLMNSFPSGNDLNLLACYHSCAVASEFGVVEVKRSTNSVQELRDALNAYDKSIRYDSSAEHAMIAMYSRFGELLSYFDNHPNDEKCFALFSEKQWATLRKLSAPAAAIQFQVWALNAQLKGIQLEFRPAQEEVFK